MAFVTDKEELKPGLIIFRRADVDHNNWYCRIKLPKEDRYKTISLKTSNVNDARAQAFDQDADIRFRIKHDVAIFNRSFSQVGEEYIEHLQKRASAGEIKQGRVARVTSVLRGRLQEYVGTTQVHLIGQDRWEGYPTWRRKQGQGRMARPGHTRPFTEDELKLREAEQEAKTKAEAVRLASRRKKQASAKPKRRERTEWVFVSDDTILHEMTIFKGVMNFAASKRYIPAGHRFEGKPNLKKMRRDEFTLEEYRALHQEGRRWIKESVSGSAEHWRRLVAYNFILIMCNTGMRPPEAKNLRWRDITTGIDRGKREVVVMHVQGKGLTRKLVAPQSTADYLARIKKISNATQPDDPVFTNHNGKSALWLYKRQIETLLNRADLRIGPSGTPRSTYCFRHTYATFRLAEGVDVYSLAQQMGTSVKMIEDHYGHVNTIKHADLVLQGMGSWETPAEEAEEADEDDKAVKPEVKKAAAVVKIKQTRPAAKQSRARRTS